MPIKFYKVLFLTGHNIKWYSFCNFSIKCHIFWQNKKKRIWQTILINQKKKKKKLQRSWWKLVLNSQNKVLKHKTTDSFYGLQMPCKDSLNSEILRVRSQCANPQPKIKGSPLCTVCLASNIIYFIKNNYQIYTSVSLY